MQEIGSDLYSQCATAQVLIIELYEDSYEVKEYFYLTCLWQALSGPSLYNLRSDVSGQFRH